MPISGHSNDISLTDLLQIKSGRLGTSRISVVGPAGHGLLVVDSGRVVHAEYGGLEGREAATALVVEDDVHYQVRSDVRVRRRTMSTEVTELLLDAVHRQDEGLVPVTRTLQLEGDLAPGANAATAGRAGAGGGSGPPADVPRPRAPSDRPRMAGRRLVLGAVAVGLVALAGLAFALRSETAPPSPRSEALGSARTFPEVREPVDPRDLDGPNDRLPTLLDGRPPEVPDPDAPLRPTIVCRLLVSTDGSVADAEVYRPTPGLEHLERIALDAVRSYRFTPAEREGIPVPVWINWPVDFV